MNGRVPARFLAKKPLVGSALCPFEPLFFTALHSILASLRLPGIAPLWLDPCGSCMPISEAFFTQLHYFTVAELLELLIVIAAVIRAKLSAISITFNDIQNSTLSGLRREADRTGRLARIEDPSNDPPLAYLNLGRARSRSRNTARRPRRRTSPSTSWCSDSELSEP